MAGTRSTFASVGVSLMLVGAAALGLLAVSAVFAFGGWTATEARSAKNPALILAGTSPQSDASAVVKAAPASPLVVARPVRTRAREDVPRSRGASEAARAAERPATTQRPPAATPTPVLDPPVTQTVTPRPDPPRVSQQRPAAGDGVRKVGDDLSSTVQGTGAALAEATQPLAPPVSVAVQEVLNLVAALVRRTTGGLAGALDTLLAPK